MISTIKKLLHVKHAVKRIAELELAAAVEDDLHRRLLAKLESVERERDNYKGLYQYAINTCDKRRIAIEKAEKIKAEDDAVIKRLEERINTNFEDRYELAKALCDLADKARALSGVSKEEAIKATGRKPSEGELGDLAHIEYVIQKTSSSNQLTRKIATTCLQVARAFGVPVGHDTPIPVDPCLFMEVDIDGPLLALDYIKAAANTKLEKSKDSEPQDDKTRELELYVAGELGFELEDLRGEYPNAADSIRHMVGKCAHHHQAELDAVVAELQKSERLREREEHVAMKQAAGGRQFARMIENLTKQLAAEKKRADDAELAISEMPSKLGGRGGVDLLNRKEIVDLHVRIEDLTSELEECSRFSDEDDIPIAFLQERDKLRSDVEELEAKLAAVSQDRDQLRGKLDVMTTIVEHGNAVDDAKLAKLEARMNPRPIYDVLNKHGFRRTPTRSDNDPRTVARAVDAAIKDALNREKEFDAIGRFAELEAIVDKFRIVIVARDNVNILQITEGDLARAFVTKLGHLTGRIS